MTLDGAIVFTLGLLFFTWFGWYVVQWGYFAVARFSIWFERKVTRRHETE